MPPTCAEFVSPVVNGYNHSYQHGRAKLGVVPTHAVERGLDCTLHGACVRAALAGTVFVFVVAMVQ